LEEYNFIEVLSTFKNKKGRGGSFKIKFLIAIFGIALALNLIHIYICFCGQGESYQRK